uniref:NADH dehydrogenase subunit 5 n=1 Tax=Ornithodoros erraticus TaxID=265619 RepID=UPI002237501F|nr:NADH dehydrogenase subunit 5 [Ornithodoros erraticus]UYB78282.1 NADH dehydrogenase subunit 5 [Ornithodoros erraticus]UYB78295.1 NADH dehydrogenase subunit 5 [Ornithodoros erraticus]
MFFKWGLMLVFMSFLWAGLGFSFLLDFKVVLVEYFLMVLFNYEIKMFMLFDWMSLIFVGVVMFISGMVILYSYDYMYMEPTSNYFCYGVLLFVASMVMMIISPNMIMILIGWDGLGLISYCLVIYYQNSKSDSAGMITVLSNRVGDVMILLSMVMLLQFGTLDFYIYKEMYVLGGLMILIAGLTSSAQIPFSAWLPAAMAAPTPVSSLVHSSTLVTAGVYLLIRFNLLFLIDFYSKFLLFLALMTMLMSGLGAIVEMDLKKIIALSTLSQLGLMMLILAMGAWDMSFFHLLTHAMFKAMLFLCAGCMIHMSLGNQDIRYMGVFYSTKPLVSFLFGLANMALFGLPFLSGFFSKDMILEYIYKMEGNFIIIMLVIFSTICTCVYSFRVMYYTVWKGISMASSFNFPSSFWMEGPVVLMGALVVFMGSFLSWSFPLYEVFELQLYVKLINFLIIILGSWVFFLKYFGKLLLMNFGMMNDFFSSMWFLSKITSGCFMKTMIFGNFFLSDDNSWLEEVGPQGVYKLNLSLGKVVQWLQDNEFKNYVFFLIVLSLSLF